jgi:hypothetical protein
VRIVTVADTALLVAIASAIVSATSIGWQVIAFVRNRHRVTCTLSMGAENKEETLHGVATLSLTLSADEWSKSPEFRSEPDQRFIVEVTNTGRASAYVDSIAMTTDHETFTVMHSANAGESGPELPCLLEAGQTHRWHLPITDYRAMWKNPSGRHCAHAQATLGTGRKIVSKEGVTLALLKEAGTGTRSFLTTRPRHA